MLLRLQLFSTFSKSKPTRRVESAFKDAHHALALVFDGTHERGEMREAAPDDALILRLRGADTRELKLLHTRRQRQLRCA